MKHQLSLDTCRITFVVNINRVMERLETVTIKTCMLGLLLLPTFVFFSHMCVCIHAILEVERVYNNKTSHHATKMYSHRRQYPSIKEPM